MPSDRPGLHTKGPGGNQSTQEALAFLLPALDNSSSDLLTSRKEIAPEVFLDEKEITCFCQTPLLQTLDFTLTTSKYFHFLFSIILEIKNCSILTNPSVY